MPVPRIWGCWSHDTYISSCAGSPCAAGRMRVWSELLPTCKLCTGQQNYVYYWLLLQAVFACVDVSLFTECVAAIVKTPFPLISPVIQLTILPCIDPFDTRLMFVVYQVLSLPSPCCLFAFISTHLPGNSFRYVSVPICGTFHTLTT